MKMLISFIAGIAVCSLIIFGFRTATPTQASAKASTEESNNSTMSLVKLIPNIEKIYRESLTAPFIKAESKIYDEDILEFYRELMDKTGLNDPGTDVESTEE
jgi:hypothetical protein